MKKANYIVLDVETGGLDYSKNPITQIAMVGVDAVTLKEINRFETYIKPYDDLTIEVEALKATGLKMVDINNGVDKKQAVRLIKNFCKTISPNNRPENRPVLVAHNATFDQGFVKSLFARNNVRYGKTFNQSYICTMALSKMFNTNASSLRLGDCCKAMGVELNDAHKAMNDTLATTELFRAYVKKLMNNQIVVDNNKSQIKSRMRFQF